MRAPPGANTPTAHARRRRESEVFVPHQARTQQQPADAVATLSATLHISRCELNKNAWMKFEGSLRSYAIFIP